MSSQNAGPGLGWGEVVNGLAGVKGKLVLACDSLRGHRPILSNCSMNCGGPPNFDLCLLSSVVPQGSAQTPLCAPRGGICPQGKAGDQGADLRAFLRDCNLMPPVGQCLETVASYGLSSCILFAVEGRISPVQATSS